LSYRSKNIFEPILILIVVFLLVFVTYQYEFKTNYNDLRIGYIGSESKREWKGTYKRLYGSLRSTLVANTDDETLHFNIMTYAGELSVKIIDYDGNVVFEQENISEDSYTIQTTKIITIKLNANSHSGSFDFYFA